MENIKKTRRVDPEVDEGVDPSARDNYAIRKASLEGHTDEVRLLLQDERVDPSDLRNQAIIIASRKGHTEIVRLLLQDGRVDPSDQHNRSIRLASWNGHIEIVRLLLQDERVNPADQENDAILEATPEIVRLLLQDERVDPSDQDNRAIKKALRKGYTEIVKLLLQDPRVDWRLLIGTPFEYLIEERRRRFRDSILPVVQIYQNVSGFGQVGPKGARELTRRVFFYQAIKTLCEDIREDSIPSVELLQLAAMLHATNYIGDDELQHMRQSNNKREVCEGVHRALRDFQRNL
jgi:hypothetical protein